MWYVIDCEAALGTALARTDMQAKLNHPSRLNFCFPLPLLLSLSPFNKISLYESDQNENLLNLPFPS